MRDDPAATATSISPDRLAGLPPHGVGTTVWSYDQGYQPPQPQPPQEAYYEGGQAHEYPQQGNQDALRWVLWLRCVVPGVDQGDAAELVRLMAPYN